MLGEYCAAVAGAVTNGMVQYGQAVIIGAGALVGVTSALVYRNKTKNQRYLRNDDE